MLTSVKCLTNYSNTKFPRVRYLLIIFVWCILLEMFGHGTALSILYNVGINSSVRGKKNYFAKLIITSYFYIVCLVFVNAFRPFLEFSISSGPV